MYFNIQLNYPSRSRNRTSEEQTKWEDPVIEIKAEEVEVEAINKHQIRTQKIKKDRRLFFLQWLE